MSTPFKMKGSPVNLGTIQGTAGHSSALKQKAWLLKQAIKYGSKVYKSIFGTTKTTSKVSTKVKPKIKIKHIGKDKGVVTEITPTSEISRTSWPNVKAGEVSSFPGTTTLPDGRVIPYDATRRQVFK